MIRTSPLLAIIIKVCSRLQVRVFSPASSISYTARGATISSILVSACTKKIKLAMAITPQTQVWRLGVSIEQFILILYPTLLIPAVVFWYIDLKRRRSSAARPVGCKNISIREDRSNITDEYDDHKYAEGVQSGVEASGEPRWKVKALFIHPIKSCAPIEIDSSEVEGSGLRYDRKFAWAELLTPQTRLDAPESEKKPIWTFRTLRQPGYNKLVHVKPEVWVPDETLTQKAGSKVDTQGALIIRYPYVPSGFLAAADRLAVRLGWLPKEVSFQVPLEPLPNHKYPSEDVVIFKSTPRWLNYGKHVPDDFRRYLGVTNPVTLFRSDPESYREVHRNAPTKEQLGYQPSVGFPDAYPVHLLNIASVRDIAGKVKDDIPKFSVRRFRSNILITGPSAYDEDDWKRVRIGREEFHCACHTVRCRLPNVDPDTSERHDIEPDKTLKSFRCIDDGDPKNACLGLMLVPVKEKGVTIRAGQEIEVLERGEHHYLMK